MGSLSIFKLSSSWKAKILGGTFEVTAEDALGAPLLHGFTKGRSNHMSEKPWVKGSGRRKMIPFFLEYACHPAAQNAPGTPPLARSEDKVLATTIDSMWFSCPASLTHCFPLSHSAGATLPTLWSSTRQEHSCLKDTALAVPSAWMLIPWHLLLCLPDLCSHVTFSVSPSQPQYFLFNLSVFFLKFGVMKEIL